MKRARIIGVMAIGVVLGTVGIVRGVRHVGASEIAPPTTMTHVDAVELELALTKLDVLSRQAQPIVEKRDVLLARYKIPANDLGRSISVDFTTGEIKRASAAIANAEASPKK